MNIDHGMIIVSIIVTLTTIGIGSVLMSIVFEREKVKEDVVLEKATTKTNNDKPPEFEPSNNLFDFFDEQK